MMVLRMEAKPAGKQAQEVGAKAMAETLNEPSKTKGQAVS